MLSARSSSKSTIFLRMSSSYRRRTIQNFSTVLSGGDFSCASELPYPTLAQIREYLELISQRLNFELGLSYKALAEKLNGASFSELEDFISDVARKYVLALPGGEPKTIVASKLRQWKVRALVTGPKAGK